MNAFKLKALAFAAALVGSASAMAAGSATANLANTATIAASCTLTATGFTSTYDPVAANATAATPVKDSSASVTYTCTNGGTGALIALGGGGHDTGTPAVPIRHLAGTINTADLLAYNLYQESTYTTPWGYATTAEVSAVEDGTQHVLTVYTEIPGNQGTLHVDTYTDTVVANITF